MNDESKLKPMPLLLSDEAAEESVATADLSEYDLSGFKPVRFVLEKSTTQYARDARRTRPSGDPARNVATSY